MNENAKAWVAALRSGDYQQGRSYLRRGDSYCCLGVACELAVLAGVPIKRGEHQDPGVVSYDGNTGMVPPAVEAWLGLVDPEGGFVGGLLTKLNDDDGLTFDEIADLIESEPEGMFVR